MEDSCSARELLRLGTGAVTAKGGVATHPLDEGASCLHLVLWVHHPWNGHSTGKNVYKPSRHRDLRPPTASYRPGRMSRREAEGRKREGSSEVHSQNPEDASGYT